MPNKLNPYGDPNVSDKIASNQETQNNEAFESEYRDILKGIVNKVASVPGKTASATAGGLKNIMGLYQNLVDGIDKHVNDGGSDDQKSVVKNAMKKVSPKNKAPAPQDGSSQGAAAGSTMPRPMTAPTRPPVAPTASPAQTGAPTAVPQPFSRPTAAQQQNINKLGNNPV